MYIITTQVCKSLFFVAYLLSHYSTIICTIQLCAFMNKTAVMSKGRQPLLDYRTQTLGCHSQSFLFASCKNSWEYREKIDFCLITDSSQKLQGKMRDLV